MNWLDTVKCKLRIHCFSDWVIIPHIPEGPIEKEFYARVPKRKRAYRGLMSLIKAARCDNCGILRFGCASQRDLTAWQKLDLTGLRKEAERRLLVLEESGRLTGSNFKVETVNEFIAGLQQGRHSIDWKD